MDNLTAEQALALKSGPALRLHAEKRALDIFHNAADRVPAYRDFLRVNKIDHRKIATIADFTSVPTTDAKNYIAKYPVGERCWDGRLQHSQFIATSSGTTGEPKYWPRTIEQDLEATAVHEFLYKEYFQTDTHTTLFLIGFPMGVYVSGIATLLPSWLLTFKHPGMTVMSIGNNKSEMLRAVKHLADEFDQTILIGHPFFIKDVLETGVREGIAWKKKNIGLMFCSEGFTEDWRDYVKAKAAIPKASMRVFNTYGSSEMLLMGYETPFSIRVKTLAEKDGDFSKRLTGTTMPPQFFQYNPYLRYIESVNEELVFTSDSGIPLIRFDLHDRGGVHTMEDVAKALGRTKLPKPSKALPLVSLRGRSDQTVIFYAANIYPEHIKAGVVARSFLKMLTGKFTLRKGYLRNLDEFLEINVELQPGVRATRALATAIQRTIVAKLEEVNIEYRFLREHLDKDIVPRVELWPYGHEKYFRPGLKPRFIDAAQNKK